MIEVTVDIAALSKLIDDLGEGFDDEVVEAMAQEILDGADQLVPVDTGALKESGHVEERRGGASGEPGGALSVDTWELRQIDGMQAYFGRVEAAGETILLGPGGERPPIPLDDVPNDLRRSGGRKAWVAGLWMAGAFSVRSFGIFPAP